MLDLPNSGMKRIEVELKSMLGRMAVAPQGEESWAGLWPGDFGCNMDASDSPLSIPDILLRRL